MIFVMATLMIVVIIVSITAIKIPFVGRHKGILIAVISSESISFVVRIFRTY